MTEVENPQLTLERLEILEKRFDSNIATNKDYALIDDYLVAMGVEPYIINKLKDKGIISYDDFLAEKKKPASERNIIFEAEVLGGILGIISALKRINTNRI